MWLLSDLRFTPRNLTEEEMFFGLIAKKRKRHRKGSLLSFEDDARRSKLSTFKGISESMKIENRALSKSIQKQFSNKILQVEKRGLLEVLNP